MIKPGSCTKKPSCLESDNPWEVYWFFLSIVKATENCQTQHFTVHILGITFLIIQLISAHEIEQE